MRSLFAFPINRHHPPAISIEQQLKAVDSPRERLVALGVAGFVGAPNVRNPVPALYAIGNRRLKEALFFKEGLGPSNVFVRSHAVGRHFAILAAPGGD